MKAKAEKYPHHPTIGSVWKEADPRFERKVKVIGKDPITGKIIIEHAGRTTKADPKRFNGKRGGYSFVSEK